MSITKNLFDITKIKNMTMKNRFIRSATWEQLADEKGHLTDNLFLLYENLAKGGVGTIITGYTNVLESDKPSPNMLGIYDDSFIDEYKIFTDKIHEYGANILMQIVHGGSNSNYKLEERILLAPSAVENIAMKSIPKEMSKQEIKEVVKAFADAAARVKKAGSDGVQLHVAHGFLLNQFLAPYYNRRKDEYGGTLENRARIVFECYEEVRKSVGYDFPVWIKINCDDFMDEGFTFEESLYVCKELSKKGVDLIEISGGSYSSRINEGPARTGIIKKDNESYFKDFAARIAREVDIPVSLVGGNRSLENMEYILNSTEIEFFSLARPLLCEPNLINRWKSGNTDKAKCISCNQCFVVEGSRHCVFNE